MLTYNGDRYGFQVGHLMVGDAFEPTIGFVRRRDFDATSASARFSPRFVGSLVRRMVWQGNVDHLLNRTTDELESREIGGQVRFELNSGDNWQIQYSRQIDVLTDTFPIATGVVLPVGKYRFGGWNTQYMLGPQHRVSGRLSAEYGTFYNGDRKALGYGGRVELSTRLSLEPSISQNWVDLDQGSFTRRLATARLIFTPSPQSVFAGLVQYNSSNHSWSSNLRFRWEYAPGSDLFLVYSDGRDTNGDGFPDLTNRTLAVKMTRSLRF
jgi:hypothetical protein